MPLQSGTVEMSSDDPEWRLHEGSGDRTADSTVVFVPAFAEAPQVVVSLSGFTAAAGGAQQDVDVRAKNVSKESFEVEFATTGTARIMGVAASWLAYTDQAAVGPT